MTLTLREAQNALSLPLDAPAPEDAADVVFTGVCTDTRTLRPGELFVALHSPTRDGHGYIAQALEKGAAGVVVSQDTGAALRVPVLRVPNTQVAYGQLARAWRARFTLPVIGVTGSVGKTTTKEMLAAALSPLGPVLKTQASQNNETGVPKALLQLDDTHRAAAIEMGMRGAGQIAYLCDIAQPTAGVVTVIGTNHLELLGSQEAIADAKSEMLQALPPDGIALLNADDPFAPRLRAKTRARVVTFGVNSDADFRAQDILPTDGGWQFTVNGQCVRLHSPARHDIANALAALAAAHCHGVALRDAADALANYQPPPMRMETQNLAWGGTLLNDAYNASPASTTSALQTLAEYPGARKIAFLGDMKELGETGPQAHAALGQTIASLGGLHALYTVGELAAHIPGAAARFAHSEDAAQAVSTLNWQPGDVILVKGSRAMAMERVAQALATGRPQRGHDGH